MGSYESELNLKETELTLGLPGSGSVVKNNKRSSPESSVEDSNASDYSSTTSDHDQVQEQPTK